MQQFPRSAVAVFLLAALSLAAQFPRSVAAEGIDGFRSAKFGIDEQAVRAAILKDFPVQEERIQRIEDKVRKVVGLVVELSVLEPGGPASVSYWLGHSCNCLTRVRVVWGLAPGMDAEQAAGDLLSTALILRNEFLARDWPPDSVVVNRLVESALILFRGEDEEKRDVLLVASPVQLSGGGEDEGSRNADFSAVRALELVYARSLEDPDVFKLRGGLF